ncbi:MAG TPA: efflux RND transporter periplasmic adaptor subunit [Caulobacteraceae bacterium]|jgi:RND family efflux transporter MFP subunit|nr:efflux RND transporter periplasmic adaptor subunit [Caulobacteraceae bacterium]
MSRNRILAILAVLVLVGGVIALALSRKGGEEAEVEVNPVAVVTTAPVRSQRVEDVISVYGVVQADPSGSITVAAPKPVIVSRMLVRSGQTVARGQALVEVANAPAADLSYTQAADAERFARTELERVQRLYDERLAAADQLTAARKALADAQSALAAQQKQGAGRARQTIGAPEGGVVTTVSAAAGDHVAQDAALLVLSRAGAATVKLGLEPSAGTFAPGQAVTIRPVTGGTTVASHIAMVGRAADQTTKTLDAIVPLNGAPLPIGTPVQGDVVTGARTGLVVPRGAVVFDETGPHLFAIAGDKAKRVFVTVGRDLGDDIEVRGVPAGAQVAVEGAYELQDGMAVKVRGK